MVIYPILLSQSWSTTVPNFMLVSGIAQSGQNLALSRLANKPHTCGTCGKQFIQLSNLKNHMVTHTGDKTFTCFTCGIGFTRSSVLKKTQAYSNEISRIYEGRSIFNENSTVYPKILYLNTS